MRRILLVLLCILIAAIGAISQETMGKSMHSISLGNDCAGEMVFQTSEFI